MKHFTATLFRFIVVMMLLVNMLQANKDGLIHKDTYVFHDIHGKELTVHITSKLKIEQFKNKIIIIDLNSYGSTEGTWLTLHMINQLIKIQKKYNNEVQVIGFDNSKHSREKIDQFLKKNKIIYPVIAKDKESSEFTAFLKKALKTYGWPNAIVFDKDGYYVHTILGYTEKVEDWIDIILDPKLNKTLEKELVQFLSRYIKKEHMQQKKYDEAIRVIAQIYVHNYGKKAKEKIKSTIEYHRDEFLRYIKDIASKIETSKRQQPI